MKALKFYIHLLLMCFILNYFIWEPAGLFNKIKAGDAGSVLVGLMAIGISMIIVCVTLVNFAEVSQERPDR